MSYCDLFRQPAKRMVILFNYDNSTCIMDTSKAKKVVDGNKIEEGATVLVDFENKEYEARVLKLHGK